jgi:hypothetical protein
MGSQFAKEGNIDHMIYMEYINHIDHIIYLGSKKWAYGRHPRETS